MKIGDFRAYEREVGTAELGALHGCKAHPSEAIANLAMSTGVFNSVGTARTLVKKRQEGIAVDPSWSGVG